MTKWFQLKMTDFFEQYNFYSCKIFQNTFIIRQYLKILYELLKIFKNKRVLTKQQCSLNFLYNICFFLLVVPDKREDNPKWYINVIIFICINDTLVITRYRFSLNTWIIYQEKIADIIDVKKNRKQVLVTIRFTINRSFVQHLDRNPSTW